MTITPFRIDFPQADLDDLHDRLDRTRWPDELPNVGWAYGVPLDYLRGLVEYWRQDYDWRAAEAALNDWPQFTTEIDGATIHFAHLRSPEPDATPLIMTHGWPGSIVEFAQVVGPLTNPRAFGGEARDAFHLVVPSIPGFGLSGPTRETRWEHRRVATAFGTLMSELGYERFGAQGGDWGAGISQELGRVYPDRLIGIHLNMLPGAPATTQPTDEELAPLSPAERERTLASFERWKKWIREQVGYAMVQSTRPQTLSYGLTDSPVGQLAWIAEKFREWIDPSSTIDRDLLLTNVTLYWLTKTAGSSARIYYERAHSTYADERSDVPTAYAEFPHENFILMRHIAERSNNLVRWTTFDRGGHFAAVEVPDLLVGDLRAFFGSL